MDLTSSELFINMKHKPKWDRKKHFFEQSTDVLQFYENERQKLIHGVNIGGYHFHPHLYWHINYFKTPIPIKGKGEVVMTPPLDDNILYIIESYKEAQEKDLGLCIFGTRGAAKSSYIASLSTWINAMKPNGVMSITGGSSDDLKSISRLIKTSFENRNDAFYVNNMRNNWDSEVVSGFRMKDNEVISHGNIAITNANAGKGTSSEKGAGLSPVGFVVDEIGKFSCRGLIESAIPSFITPFGAKLTYIVAGTAGNVALTEDARYILQHPEEFSLLQTNYDLLDRKVPEEYLTWEKTKNKKFSVFVPGQMSYRLSAERDTSKLSDFLDISHPDLDKVEIKTTNWAKATKALNTKLALIKDVEKRRKEKAYYPQNLDDCFATASHNPFPVAVIQNHIMRLEESGDIGESVDIIRTEGNKYKKMFSEKQRADVSHGGGTIDSPMVLFNTLPSEKPKEGMFCAGMDSYKLDNSTTSSLGALYVLKRRNLEPNSPCETIEVSYVSRPTAGQKEFNQGAEMLSELYNCQVLMESIDMSFKQYLDQRDKSYDILVPALDFKSLISKAKPRSDAASKFGMYPSQGNNQYRFNLLVDYCKERHTVGIDDDGNEIVKLGVEFINDVDLLKEMLSWYKDGNFDRIVAFSHALVYCRELDKKGIRPKEDRQAITEANGAPKRAPRQRYGNSSRRRYRGL